MSLTSPTPFPFILYSAVLYVSYISPSLSLCLSVSLFLSLSLSLSPGFEAFETESLTKWHDSLIIGFYTVYYLQGTLYAMNRCKRSSLSTGYLTLMRRILKVPG
jgi:hypothetical protein